MKLLKILALALAFATSAVFAADTTPATPKDPQMDQARAYIAARNWPAAQGVLEQYVKANPSSADGFNLLGYSLRNIKKYDDSLVAYKRALTLDPKHKGAHEYIGIAYVQMGQLDKAKEHLASLDKLCPFSCEEYRDLKKAIAEAPAK
jgi:cytochrome c-type biogenesis protein CcmH/NrfG